jgi:hypothetical protein
LLERRNKVVFSGVAAARIASGSVESSVCSIGQPGLTPSTARSTSGARLEPPMPRSTTSVNPSALTRSANDRMRPIDPAITAGEFSHPSRFAILSWTPLSLLQTAGLRHHSPAAARSAVAIWRRTASATGPGDTWNPC